MAYYEPGRYLVKVVRQGFGTSKKKGTPYFFLTIRPQRRIVEELDGEEITEPIANEHDRDIELYLTQNTIAFQLEALRGLGWGGNSFSEIDPSYPGHHSFVGQEVKATCEHTGDGDKVYDNWSLMMLTTEREHHAPEGLVRTLDEEYRDILTDTATGTAPRPAPPEDEIPF